MSDHHGDTARECDSGAPSRSLRGWYYRGYLPHCDGGPLTHVVTFRLADSLPQDIVEHWKDELNHLSSADAKTKLFHRIEKCLDRGLGACHLREPRIGGLVQDALLYFDGKRYDLHAWVIMPNHVHVLFTPSEGEQLERILHSWKSFTSKKANWILGRDGSFWQREFHDRFVRDQEHFLSALRYIEENPVAAGLCRRKEDWKLGSAFERLRARRFDS